MSEKISVLIVDDQKNWRELLVEILTDQTNQFEVKSAESYERALEIIRDQKPPFYIIVTDIRLIDANEKNADGLLLIEELNKLGSKTKTIVVTGYPSQEIARSLLKLDAYDYLEKHPSKGGTFNHEEFLKIVREAANEAENDRNKSKLTDIDIFVLMPFAPNYKEIYTLIQEVANELGLICKRSDDIPVPGPIMEQVEKSIERSRIIIADLTDKNLNVYFETGISDAKGKPVILLAPTEDDLARSLEGNRVILYEDSFKGSRELKTNLKKQIEFISSSDGQFQESYDQKERGVSKFCLAITANSKAGEDTYKSIIRPVVTTQEVECKYVWDFYKAPKTKDATKTIKNNLGSADLIVTDLTGKDVDVYYLSGFAFGLNRYPVILYDKRGEIPFDIRTIGKIAYSKDTEDDRNEVKRELTEAVKHGTTGNISQGAIMNKIKVFINHATEDKPLVQKLHSELKKVPWIDLWIDEERLLPGQELELEIDKAMKEADAVLVCISKISVKKTGYVQAEIRKAEEQQKLRPPGLIYMIPVLLESCKDQVPANLQKYLWVDISDPGKIASIIKSLETLRK